MSKKIIILFVLCIGFIGVGTAQNKNVHPYTVVIDAGHGGKDPGAVGAFVYEKTLNLSVALKAGKMIKEAYPEVEVVYTRSTDVFLPLQARADTVNKHNADLFISIHTNSSESHQACGAETYILGVDRLGENLDIAMRENAVIKLESDYETAYQGFDPNSIDSYIMFELMQNNYVDQSLQYASALQKRFVEKLPMTNRGVRQAAYWVLLKSACPSVLVEMGFISNPKEERYLSSDEGQTNIAKSLFESFCSFYHKPPRMAAPEVQKDTLKRKDTTTVVVNEPVREQPKDTPKVVVAEPVKVTPEVIVTTPQPDTAKVAEKEAVKVQPKDTVKVETVNVSLPIYVVQIMALREPIKDKADLKGYDCQYFQKDGWYKYYYGPTNDNAKAKETLNKLRTAFPGCFITILPVSNK